MALDATVTVLHSSLLTARRDLFVSSAHWNMLSALDVTGRAKHFQMTKLPRPPQHTVCSLSGLEPEAFVAALLHSSALTGKTNISESVIGVS